MFTCCSNAIHSHNNTTQKHIRQHSLFIAPFGDCMLNMVPHIKRLVFGKCWVCDVSFFVRLFGISMKRIGFVSIKCPTSHPIGNMMKAIIWWDHWWSLAYRPEAIAANSDNKCLLIPFHLSGFFLVFFSFVLHFLFLCWLLWYRKRDKQRCKDCGLCFSTLFSHSLTINLFVWRSVRWLASNHMVN